MKSKEDVRLGKETREPRKVSDEINEITNRDEWMQVEE